MRFIILMILITTQGVAPTATFANTDSEALALRLIDSQGCKACHRLNGAGVGASIGPELDKVGMRLTKEQLRNTLVNSQKSHGAKRIADFSHLQKQELEALVNYLSTRK